MKYIVQLVFYVFMWGRFFSQDPYSILIDKRAGLPSNSIYTIFQDSKGFIWISHDEGLSRYDGKEFKTYTCPEQTSTAGASIKEDHLGRIWYENFDGYLYYVENDSLKPMKQGKPVGFVHYAIIKDHLYIMEYKKVAMYDLDDLYLIKKIPLNTDSVGNAHFTDSNYFIIGKPLLKINYEGEISTVGEKSIISVRRVGASVTDGKKLLLYDLYNKNKTCYQLVNTRLEEKFKIPINEILQSSSYTDSAYWFCTPKGVYAFNENGLRRNNGLPYFKESSITSVLKDREGNFWFGSNQGIYFVSDIHSQLLSKDIKAQRISVHGNRLLIATKTDEIYSFDMLSRKLDLMYNGGSNKEMYSFLYDTLDRKIFLTSKFFTVLDDKGKLLSQNILATKDLRKVNSKYYAFAATGICGVFTLRPEEFNEWDSSFTKIRNENGLLIKYSLSVTRGKSVVYLEKNKTLVFATNVGLFSHKLGENPKEKLKNNKSIYIARLQQYGDRVFALSTQHELLEVSVKEEKIDLESKKLAPNIKVIDMKVCGRYLFLIGEKKVLCIDLTKKEFNAFETGINIPGKDISDIELWNSQVIVCANTSLLSFRFKEQVSAEDKPLLVINHLKVNGRITAIDSKKTLNYSSNNIEIDYSILSFKTGSKYPLFYKINENEWEEAAPELRALKLAALSPGDYTVLFRLGSINNQLFDKTLQFSIAKPWWQTWWAIAVFACLILTGFISIYKWQTGILKRKNQLLQQKFLLEMDLRKSVLKSIKAQMNPHFFYNALNTIQNFIFMDDKRNASTYLSKFSKLTRTILEMSEKETVSLDDELEALKLYLDIEKVRFSEDFNFKIEVAQEINKELTKIPSMLIQPYVENAIKHGLLHKKGNKELIIDFALENRTLVITVDDNGIGQERSAEINRAKQGKHQPFAIIANSKRLDILNKGEEKIGVEYSAKTDDFGNSMGTKVIIRIPIR